MTNVWKYKFFGPSIWMVLKILDDNIWTEFKENHLEERMEDEEKRTPRFGASGRFLTFTNILSFKNLSSRVGRSCQDLDLLEIKLKPFHSLGNILTNHNFNLLENIWTNKNVKSRIFLFPQWLIFKHEICNLSPLTKSFLNISCESVQIATKKSHLKFLHVTKNSPRTMFATNTTHLCQVDSGKIYCELKPFQVSRNILINNNFKFRVFLSPPGCVRPYTFTCY